MKFVIIILVALLLLGAGGAGGYFYFQNTAVASLGDVDEAALDAKHAEEDAKQAAIDKFENLRFVKLDPIILPIIDGNGVSQVVTLVISLEVDGEMNALRAKRLSPRLKDAYIRDMYGVLNRKASMAGGVIKVDELKERLNRLSVEVLGADNVNSVLLQVVNQRPI